MGLAPVQSIGNIGGGGGKRDDDDQGPSQAQSKFSVRAVGCLCVAPLPCFRVHTT